MTKKILSFWLVTWLAAVSTDSIAAQPAKKKEADSNSDKVVFLVPGWIVPLSEKRDRGLKHICSDGMQDYIYKLLRHAHNGGRPPLGKDEYYAYATYLGYFSDDPVKKDEIVEKIKPTVDRDIQRIANLIHSGAYFLFVGETGESLEAVWLPKIGQPILQSDGSFGHYDWKSNTFGVQAQSQFVYYGAIDKSISASPKDWKQKWEPIFSDDNKGKLGGRLLLDSQLRAVLAEIFDKKTGKTVLKWAAEGQDAEELSALIPETPESDYNFDRCFDLNPEYFSASGK